MFSFPNRYKNTYGTIYHDPKTGARVRLQSAIVNLASEHILGGGRSPAY